MDDFALRAWTAQVRRLALKRRIKATFDIRAFSAENLRALAQLSRLEDGPKLAIEWLEARGVVVVVLPHLPRTRLDGAAFLSSDGRPVIALTIRYDRLDNFWFTLMHEIGHIIRHLSQATADAPTEYIDDLDVEVPADAREVEADAFARECLVPSVAWEQSAVSYVPAVDTAQALADELGVNPAIVAGRVRYEKRNFRLLSGLVGTGLVRKHFPEAA
jgi:HTH-type transcriptional regulator/antitoxin HigA